MNVEHAARGFCLGIAISACGGGDEHCPSGHDGCQCADGLCLEGLECGPDLLCRAVDGGSTGPTLTTSSTGVATTTTGGDETGSVDTTTGQVVGTTTTTTTGADSSGTTGTPAMCGDGIATGAEECDGDDFAVSCQDLGYLAGGAASCRPDCTVETINCCGADPGMVTLQDRIDAAVDDDVLYVGPTTENVTIGGKRITLVGSCTGTLAPWTCADPTQRAIRLEAGADVTIDGFLFEGCDGGVSSLIQSGIVHILGPDRVVLTHNVFRNNSSHRGPVINTYQGIAMPLDGEIILEHNIMHDNHADDGGVIYINGETNIRIHDNLIYDNVADDYCGAVWLRNQVQAKLVFEKNVVWGNSAGRNPALEVYAGDGPIINSSLVTNNTPSNKAAAWGSVFSMIGGDPMFTDPAMGDFSLLPGSPAIDAGDPALPNDPDGTVTDQGAYLNLLPTEPP